jgi:7,8-dihydro-6-hydroxymethylpterin dimethyltransferase
MLRSAERPSTRPVTRTAAEHPFLLRRYVVAFCPRCHEQRGGDGGQDLTAVRRLSGYLAEADGRVWLVRGCPDHGRIVTLYDEHPRILDHLESWTARTRLPTPDSPADFRPVPASYLGGLGGAQTQHTCTLVEDITETCNLACPTCYAGSSAALTGTAPVAMVLANVDQRLAREGGHLDVVMVSGGEPTMHPELLTLLDELIARPITRVLLNTNGLRVARDDALVDHLGAHRDRIEVYLQFDGFAEATHRYHRAADLREVKRRAVARLSAAEVVTTLTMTCALGVNDHEIGAVIDLALATPFVCGVCIQPVFGSGRGRGIDPLDRLTHTGVLARLEAQTGGRVTWHDLIGLPCSHPHCCSIGYLLRTEEGTWRSLVALLGEDQLRANLALISNRIADQTLPAELRGLVAEALTGLHREGASLARADVRELFATVCERCDLGLSSLVRAVVAGRDRDALRRLVGERVVRITVKPFMDLDTMIEERLLQCCVHAGTLGERQHQCVPFCAAQAWGPLAASKLAAVSDPLVAAVPVTSRQPVAGAAPEPAVTP